MLAARHRARLAMQDGNADSREDFPARILRNPKVKRKLFASGDDVKNPEERCGLNDNQTNELMEENRRHLEEARKKYNFNFETDTPERGRYVWEKVNKDEDQVPREESNAQQTESDKGEEENQNVEDTIQNN